MAATVMIKFEKFRLIHITNVILREQKNCKHAITNYLHEGWR